MKMRKVWLNQTVHLRPNCSFQFLFISSTDPSISIWQSIGHHVSVRRLSKDCCRRDLSQLQQFLSDGWKTDHFLSCAAQARTRSCQHSPTHWYNVGNVPSNEMTSRSELDENGKMTKLVRRKSDAEIISIYNIFRHYAFKWNDVQIMPYSG